MSTDRHETDADFDRRVAEEVESLLAYSDGDGHVEPLDDLARRRWIETMLDEAETAPFEVEGDAGSGRRVSAMARALAVAGGLAVAAAVAVGVYLALSAPAPIPPSATETAEPTLLPSGSILLSSGELTFPEGSPPAGNDLTVGSAVTAEAGRAVAALPTGITLMLDRGARLRIERLDDQGIEVVLERGDLLASVAPGREAPEFSVATTRGRIAVTGTVFSISATDDRVAVEVIRGALRLEDVDGEPRTLEASRRAVLGEAGDQPIEPATLQEAKDKARVLDLLSSEGGALIGIRSVPTGASVALDGVVLGHTPLWVSVRPGHRDLDLTLAGHGPVRERLDLSPQATVSRVFEMRPIDELAALAGDDEASAATAPAAVRGKQAIPGGLTPLELLRLAQSLRASRDWKGAAQAYEALIKRHPATPEARTALLSLAAIQLDHLGQPARALANFERYLRGAAGGALVPEALYGKARALRRLGRTGAETVTLEQLLERYPSAIQAPQAERRLAELASSRPM